MNVRIAAMAAAVLVAAVAAFQTALTLGLPLGEATLGGQAPADNGVLSGPFRLLAAVQAVVFLLVGVILAGRSRGSRTSWPPVPVLGDVGHRRLPRPHTPANLAAPHPVERWVMGSITLAVAVLTSIVAAKPKAPMAANIAALAR